MQSGRGRDNIFRSDKRPPATSEHCSLVAEREPRLELDVTPYLVGDGDQQFVRADLLFERNAIDRKIPAGEFFVALDRRFYKTSIGYAFGQATVLGGGRTPDGNFHFLAIYFSK